MCILSNPTVNLLWLRGRYLCGLPTFFELCLLEHPPTMSSKESKWQFYRIWFLQVGIGCFTQVRRQICLALLRHPRHEKTSSTLERRPEGRRRSSNPDFGQGQFRSIYQAKTWLYVPKQKLSRQQAPSFWPISCTRWFCRYLHYCLQSVLRTWFQDHSFRWVGPSWNLATDEQLTARYLSARWAVE